MASKGLLKKILRKMEDDTTTVFDIEGHQVPRTFIDSTNKKYRGKVSTIEYKNDGYDVDDFVNASLGKDNNFFIHTKHNETLALYMIQETKVSFK